MLPTMTSLFQNKIEVKTISSKNYKMHIEDNVVNGSCDNLEAIKQVIFKILNTERYESVIYSWNYGIELSNLFGKHVSYVCAELERRITEALTSDDRIEGVSEFLYDTSVKRVVKVSFIVSTIFGDISMESEVNI